MTPSNSPHILVLDPDPGVRALLIAVLRRSGGCVTAYGDSDGAADPSLHGRRFAAVIVSTDMPRLDALLHALRLRPREERPTIILTTTSPATPHAPLADAVLRKPFDLAELYAAIADCFGAGEAEGDGAAGLAPQA